MNERFLARHWDEIETILDTVLEMQASDRQAYIARECVGRPEIRRAVEKLVGADESADRFLSGGYELADDAVDPEPHGPTLHEPGTTVGPYRLTRLLGQGGMGAVYLAERADGQFEQELAIKILHDGVSGRRGNERFVRERQILARFDHPNIARLLDGGVTEGGRPYFAMEHVDGATIDTYCDQNRLTLRRRLELFLQVCNAVQYAHGRFIVHRDLKPGNVLVDRNGTVKLLDFGIATPLSVSDDDATNTQASVMTPSYAAPEQFRGERATAATDVYTLGLLLYELLTGHRAHRVADESPFELHRAVLETDPERPSRVVVTETADSETSPASVAGARRLAPATLARRLNGDLDAVVMKALRKEPCARYASVEGMSRDVEAYLDSRPVDARRGTASYRLSRLLRRHRVEAISAAAVVVALTGGVVVASAQARVAAADRDRANVAQAREAAVNEFLLHELLRSPSPEFARGEDVSVMQVLDAASKNVGHALRDEPHVEASVRATLARTYASLGRLDEAVAHAEAARDRIASGASVDAVALLRSRRLVAELALASGRYQECEAELDEILTGQQRVLGAEHEDTIRTSLLRARLDQALDRWDLSRQRMEREVARLERLHPGNWRLIAEAKSLLAKSMIGQMEMFAAEGLLREVLELQRDELGPDHPDTGETLLRLGQAFQRQLRYDEAHASYLELVELRKRTHGLRHPETAFAINHVATIADRMNRLEEEERLAREVYEIYLESLGPDHPRTVRAVANLGIICMQEGRHEDAISYFGQAIEKNRQIYGELHLRTIGHMADLGEVLHRAGRVDEARAQARTVIRLLDTFAAQPDVDSHVLYRLAWYLMSVEPEEMRDPQRALPVAERAARITNGKRNEIMRILSQAQRETGDLSGAIETLYRALQTEAGRDSWSSEAQLRNYLVAAGRFEEAENFLLQSLQARRERRGDDAPLTARTLMHLGEFYRDRGRHAEAETRFREALEIYTGALYENDWRIAWAKGGLGGSLVEQGRHAEAEPLLLEAYELLEADSGSRLSRLNETRDGLVRLYESTGRLDDAASWRSRIPANYHIPD